MGSRGRKSLLPDFEFSSRSPSRREPRPSRSRLPNDAPDSPAIGQMERREVQRREQRERARRLKEEQAAAESRARREEARKAKQAAAEAEKARKAAQAELQRARRQRVLDGERRRREQKAQRFAKLDAIVAGGKTTATPPAPSQTPSTSTPTTTPSARGRRRSMEGVRRPGSSKLAALPPKAEPIRNSEDDHEASAEEARQRAEARKIEEYSQRALIEAREAAERRLQEKETRAALGQK